MRPGFYLMPIVKNLLILNGLFYLAHITFEGMNSYWMYNHLMLHDVRSVYFKPHQFITYMFMHYDFWHLLFNMFAVWMFGNTLEELWGPKRFLTFYILCGLGAAAINLGVMYYENTPLWEYFRSLPIETQSELLYDRRLNGTMAGASGAVFGILAAYGYLFPNRLLYIYGLIPIKAKWFVLLYAGAELYLGVRNSAGDSVAHWAHLGGALVGFLLVLYWNRNNRSRFY